MRKAFQFLTLVSLLILFSGTIQAQFKVIGYFPTYSNYPNGINSMDLAKITHLNIAFANPDATGTLIPGNGTNANVTTVVNACHAKGVKVFMSIGGGAATGTNYSSLLSNTTNINNFVTKIVSYATTYNLDGIDVDIEGNILNGSTITAAQYQNFVSALATGLHAQNKLMSAALATWFANYVTNTAAAQFDWINLMSYDAYGSWTGPGPHSPYSLAVSDFQYWNQTKGVSASKLVVGVPFYGYGWGTYANQGITYCTIVNTYPGSENNDQIGSGNNMISYNGIPTIKQKTNYALQNAAGIMIWELTQDCATSDSRSLLLAISQAIAAYAQAPTITFNNSTATYGDASFSVSATSNSTGAITYSITAGSQYASITSAGQVTILGAGTVTIQASQAAATGYSAGTKTSTLTISKATLTATAANKTKVYNTANPALTITYSGFKYSDNTTSITAPSISTTAVQSSNVGTYPITLSGGSAANYTIALVNGTLSITQVTPTLSYTGATTGSSGGTINLTATSNSTGAISYTVASGTGTASVNGSTLNLTQAGTVTLTVNLAATQNYTAGTVQVTITINALANPTITFNNSTATYGDASFAVSASSNSSGAITYSITSGSQYASITSAGQVTILGAGTVTIQANQAAATGYNAGTKTSTLTISKATLTATAANKTKVYNTANPALTITYSGFKYSDNTTSITAPSISTTAVQSSNVGTYPITLSGGSAANYTIALVNGTLAITQATPTLSYTGATTGSSGGTLNLTAISNSTGAVSYSVASGTGTASVNGSTLNLTQAGTVTLTVNLAATQNYTTQSVQQTITITQTATVVLGSNELIGKLNVYPNPMNDNGYIELVLQENIRGSLVLCDINGKVLKVIADGMLDVQGDYAISINEFPQGIYFLKLSTDNGNLVKKIIK